MERIVLVRIKASDIKLGDKIARASGCICALEFLAVHELRTFADGRVMFVQKSKNGTTVDGEMFVYKIGE